MKIISINQAEPRTITYRGREVSTGIYKQPATGRVQVNKLGLADDVQVDKRFHGGPDQALYAIDHSYYEYWQSELDRQDFEFGQFGENLTVVGMRDDEVYIGDTYRIGEITVQVTHPREPCFKLGVKMDDASFVKQFHEYGHVGFYLRVMQPGSVEAGDSIALEDRADDPMTVADVFRVMHLEKEDLIGAKKAAYLPNLTMAWREKLLGRL